MKMGASDPDVRDYFTDSTPEYSLKVKNSCDDRW